MPTAVGLFSALCAYCYTDKQPCVDVVRIIIITVVYIYIKQCLSPENAWHGNEAIIAMVTTSHRTQ